MEKTFFFAGSGGQGVMRAGKLLGHAASEQGKNAVYFPSYGTEMRGGMANCTVIISDSAIYSPVLEKYDFLVAFNQTAYDAFKIALKPEGTLVVNTSLVKCFDVPEKGRVLEVDTLGICTMAGAPNVSNMVLLGAIEGISRVLDADRMRQTVSEEFSAKPRVRESNLKAFDEGFNLT